MSKIAIVGWARTGSTRLSNKVIYDLGGKPAFVQVIERATHYIDADYVFVACTRDARDDPIELLAKHYGIECFRGGQAVSDRVLILGDKLGLKEDDWWIEAYCDEPLMVGDWVPWAMEQAEKHHCDCIFRDIPEGTLIATLGAVQAPVRWGFARRTTEGMIAIDELGELGTSLFTPDGFHLGAERYLIIHFPPEYLIPWPWGLLYLDHPAQALVIKEIYRQLYKGKPIDPFDVYGLFQREPRIAQMVPLSLPKANQPVMPGGEQNPILASIRLNAECVEVTWKRD